MLRFPPLQPIINRSLSALLLIVAGVPYFVTVSGMIGTMVLCYLGTILGSISGGLGGIIYCIGMSKQIPLRESIILFLSCISVEILVVKLGLAADWGLPLSAICACLVGPVAGLTVHKRVARLDPVRSRSIAQNSLVIFLLACPVFWCADFILTPK